MHWKTLVISYWSPSQKALVNRISFSESSNTHFQECNVNEPAKSDYENRVRLWNSRTKREVTARYAKRGAGVNRNPPLSWLAL